MIDCIIIDDEQHAIDLLKEHIDQVHFLRLVGTTTDPVRGLTMITDLRPRLIFLDVQMPNLTGIEILNLVGKDSYIIMTTAYKEYALEGFEHAVVDYLLKPIAFVRFLKAVNRLWTFHNATQLKSDQDSYVFVKTEQKGKLLKIDSRRITYIEGMGNYVVIQMDDQRKITAYLKLKELAEHLSTMGFVRIHKSFIISLSHLTAIEGNMVRILNETKPIVIGEAYKKEFFELVNAKLLSFSRE
ncbi:LytTR family DNA-binding domain-containing protein [Chitinophaga filiformis]|uniref:LytR/AlgR family response regulator transcription factor n=1 Tax=Chitinophaga filiformis TaxID=104663 RepID=UPI001F2A0BE5|nr:LytTR family DNA-binding domain-containing protein [Chitinophaga filiformis]MCF6402953.1 LytTR family DNA-binding domain-containing protein [Chitinophaga filiformis]